MHKKRTLIVENFSVSVTFKKMKYIRLRVDVKGIHVSAPMRTPLYEIEQFISHNRSWIAQRKMHFENLQQEKRNTLCDGAEVLFWGKKITLVEKPLVKKKRSFVQLGHDISDNRKLDSREIGHEELESPRIFFYLNPEKAQSYEHKEKLLDDFYRRSLKNTVPELLEKWQPVVGCSANDWGIKKMKTRWGSCNIDRARIWLNLELARWPRECLEYVLVHELTHLIEVNHTKRFWSLVEKAMPDWKRYHSMLKTIGTFD